MGNQEPKTKITDVDPHAWLATVTPPRRQEEGFLLLQMMEEITGEPPRMWGPSMIGFGQRHYVYASGRSGEWFRVGFSPRKAALSLYVLNAYEGEEPLLQQLGKHKAGVGCLYVNKLADVDLQILRRLIVKAWES